MYVQITEYCSLSTRLVCKLVFHFKLFFLYFWRKGNKISCLNFVTELTELPIFKITSNGLSHCLKVKFS